MENNKKIVISLGGSLIIPDEIDTEFIRTFVEIIKSYIPLGYKFYIITGGGKICRRYNDYLSKTTNPTNEELDWLGIATTRLNAEFVKICFGEFAYEKILFDPDKIPETDKPVIVGGGWKPGNSSDLAAVHIATSSQSKIILNLSNIDYVYDSDPKKNKEAKPIKEISWADFRKIIPSEWTPGINSPFDPTAAKVAEELKQEVVIMNGKNLENLKDYLDGKDFIGTTIK